MTRRRARRRPARGVPWMAVVVVGALCLAAGWTLGRRSSAVPISRPPSPRAPQVLVALLIDDCGYHENTHALIRSLQRPITLAVLPQLPYSKAADALGGQAQVEIMLHLPMEPRDGQVPERGLERHTLTTRMGAAEVRRRLTEDLDHLPHVRGVNNHMGSKATTDARLMRAVLEELKRRRLYFVDSYVTPESVCRTVARQVGIRFGRRAVFLDNVNQAQAIRAQLTRLVQAARRDGGAIGIGHDRMLTLTVIRDMLPELEAGGVRFVHVSQLVKTL